MNSTRGRKQYVEVLATHCIDGTVRPRRIVMAAGPSYDIDEADAPRAAGTRALGDSAKRYPIKIGSNRTFLYEDGGRWWVIMKE